MSRAKLRRMAIEWLQERANPEREGGLGMFADTRFWKDLVALLERAIESDRSSVPETVSENKVTVRALKTFTKARARKVWSVIGRVTNTASGFEMVRRLYTDPKWSGRTLAVFVGRKRVEQPPAPTATPTPLSPIAPTIIAETLRDCREVLNSMRARAPDDQARQIADVARNLELAEIGLLAAFGIVRRTP